jgi:DNA modification methylase
MKRAHKVPVFNYEEYMEIRKIAVDKLKAAEYNPRKDLKPGDIEFEKLKRSIEEFGYVEPVIWNERTGNVVGGHQRLKVMKYLGHSEVDCVVLDIDLQKEKALNIALNKISGEWDDTLLTALLKDLSDSGFDTTLTGFDMAEVSEMFDDESGIVEDEPPELEQAEGKKPFSNVGDIWELGKHRLMCGDSTKEADTSMLMGGNRADLYLTDPPYNVNYEGGSGLSIQNDNMDEASFLKFLLAAFRCANAVIKEGAAFYIWHAESQGGAFRTSCANALGKVRQMLIWNKNCFTMGRSDYQWKHEACLYGWKDGASHYFVDDRTQSTVFEDKKIDIGKLKKEEMRDLLKEFLSDKISTTIINEDKPARNAEHPTMKPIKLLARLIKNSSKIGEIVLDNFGGSGSTLIACEQLNRVCYTMELDPKYADVIVKRYLKFTKADEINLIRDGNRMVVKAADIL